MSVFTTIFLLIVCGLLITAIVIGWRLLKALKLYVACQAEMKTTISAFNAGIVHAEATLADFRRALGQAEGGAITPTVQPARKPRSSTLSALVDEVTSRTAGA